MSCKNRDFTLRDEPALNVVIMILFHEIAIIWMLKISYQKFYDS